MNKSNDSPSGLLILHRLRIQNANAISSPLTWGFPSPTAFLGFVHALERNLAAFGRTFGGVGIICHGFEAQTFRPNRRQHVVFTQTRNPVYLKRDAARFIIDGTPAAIVEEGRAHLVVSLVIAAYGAPLIDDQEQQDFVEAAQHAAFGMRLAGGSLLPASPSKRKQPEWVSWPWAAVDQHAAFAKIRRRLLPGFALVHRPDLLSNRLAELKAEGDAGVLDALLDLVGLNHFPETLLPDEEKSLAAANDGAPKPSLTPDNPSDEKGARVKWQIRTRPGWLVPLPIGYAGISKLYPPGEVANARDATTPFRFVESLYSLGQWIAPHRLTSLEPLLWYSAADPDTGLYRCINRYADTLSHTQSDPL